MKKTLNFYLLLHPRGVMLAATVHAAVAHGVMRSHARGGDVLGSDALDGDAQNTCAGRLMVVVALGRPAQEAHGGGAV
jgi:hypothetical protein